MQAAELTQRLIQATEPLNQSHLPSDLGASARILTAVVEVLENNNSTDKVCTIVNTLIHPGFSYVSHVWSH